MEMGLRAYIEEVRRLRAAALPRLCQSAVLQDFTQATVKIRRNLHCSTWTAFTTAGLAPFVLNPTRTTRQQPQVRCAYTLP